MSGHHNHNHRHRSSHHSRSHSSHHNHRKPDYHRDNSTSTNSWTEHRSSSGKVYYYNTRTGVSQWELPAELRQQRTVSPESELSESSSIRQQQENSPSSGASTHNSLQSDSAPEDKPLLTPSLAQYFRPELISGLYSSRTEEIEQQATQISRDVLLLSEKILDEKVSIKISKSNLHYLDTQIETQVRRCEALKDIIERFRAPNYQ